MATASLAVPKSVMKTIVGRDTEAGCAVAARSFEVGCWEHATQAKTKGTKVRKIRRDLKIVISPRQVDL
jgi:hypothetical protein